MQVNLHSNQGNQFSSYSENSVTINQLEYSENILVSAQEIKPLELNSIDDLNQEVLNQLMAMQPDIIIFGTGNKIKYPPTEVLLQLQNKQIGFEPLKFYLLITFSKVSQNSFALSIDDSLEDCFFSFIA